MLVDAALQVVDLGDDAGDRHSRARHQGLRAAPGFDQVRIVLRELQCGTDVALGDGVERRRRAAAGDRQQGNAAHMKCAHPEDSSRCHFLSARLTSADQ
jgi:hypothetical protein